MIRAFVTAITFGWAVFLMLDAVVTEPFAAIRFALGLVIALLSVLSAVRVARDLR